MTGFEEQVHALVSRLARRLVQNGWRLATAESCTGGWIAKCCTDVAGSSAWFERGFVSYSYRAKEDMLDVSHDDLLKYGAVSEEIARRMAAGMRRRSNADVALAVTGIAGPGGGMPDKPVGLVHFGWCVGDGPVACEARVFEGDRNAVRQQTVIHALEGVLARLATPPQ